MNHPEGLGSASASEVPARPPGSRYIYNFRPRSRSATAPMNRRLGSVELQGVGSTLDLPAITPPISPTPSGAGNPIHVNIPTHGNAEINTEIISHDLTTESSPPFSQLMPDTVAAGTNLPNSTLIPDTRRVGVESAYSEIVSHDSTPSSSLPYRRVYHFPHLSISIYVKLQGIH